LWPLAIAAGTLGIVAGTVFWDGGPQSLFREGVVGAVVSGALLARAPLFAEAFA
jgi:hypothetical protein